MDTLGDQFVLTKDEVRNLVLGNFRSTTCPTCQGKGWFWVDGAQGEQVDRPGDDHDHYYKHDCDKCEGIGLVVSIDEN